MNFDQFNKTSFIEAVDGVIIRVGTEELINQLFTDPDGVTHQAVVGYNPLTGTISLTFATARNGVSAYDIIRERCGAAQGSSISASSQSDRRMGLTQIQSVLWAYKKAQQEALPLQLQEMGWKKFRFFSECSSVKVELEGDVDQTYLFSPEIDTTRWVGAEFYHAKGTLSPHYREFNDWLETLEEGEDYIEL